MGKKPLGRLGLLNKKSLPNDNDAYIGFGSEYIVKEVLALRAGYKSGSHGEGSGLSAGFSFTEKV